MKQSTSMNPNLARMLRACPSVQSAEETSSSSAAKRRLISVKRLAVEELGLEPWDQFDTARREKPVMHVRVAAVLLNIPVVVLHLVHNPKSTI